MSRPPLLLIFWIHRWQCSVQWSVTSQKFEFVKLWDWPRYILERTSWKLLSRLFSQPDWPPLGLRGLVKAKIQLGKANWWWDISNAMLRCLYTYPKIDLDFRSICRESSERHNFVIGNCQICSNQLNFGKWTVFVLFFPIIFSNLIIS